MYAFQSLLYLCSQIFYTVTFLVVFTAGCFYIIIQNNAFVHRFIHKLFTQLIFLNFSTVLLCAL